MERPRYPDGRKIDRRTGAPGSSVSEASLETVIRKLIEVLKSENSALADNRVIHHGAFTGRKNQALRELLAAEAIGWSSEAIGRRAEDLRVLKNLLETNASLLKTHIGALGEVTDIIIAGLRSAESDGTYSQWGSVR